MSDWIDTLLLGGYTDTLLLGGYTDTWLLGGYIFLHAFGVSPQKPPRSSEGVVPFCQMGISGCLPCVEGQVLPGLPESWQSLG